MFPYKRQRVLPTPPAKCGKLLFSNSHPTIKITDAQSVVFGEKEWVACLKSDTYLSLTHTVKSNNRKDVVKMWRGRLDDERKARLEDVRSLQCDRASFLRSLEVCKEGEENETMQSLSRLCRVIGKHNVKISEIDEMLFNGLNTEVSFVENQLTITLYVGKLVSARHLGVENSTVVWCPSLQGDGETVVWCPSLEGDGETVGDPEMVETKKEDVFKDTVFLLPGTGGCKREWPICEHFSDVTFANGKVIACDLWDESIKIIDPKNGEELRTLGDSEFDEPQGVWFNNRLHICDYIENCIQVFDGDGKLTNCLDFWYEGSKSGEFARPVGVAASGEEVFVSDKHNDRIQVFSQVGCFTREWGTYGEMPGDLDCPEGLTIYNEEVYVCDSKNNRIQVFNKKGTFRRMWGSFGDKPGEFDRPVRLASYDGEVYVSDLFNDRVQVFDVRGVFSRQWDVDSPLAICVSDGEVFVYDSKARVVRTF